MHQLIVLTAFAKGDVATGPLKKEPKMYSGYSLNRYSHCLSLFCLFYPCLCPGVNPQLEIELDLKESPKSLLPTTSGK